MADKRCKNGHFIDESWDICPYCPPVKGAPAEGPKTSRIDSHVRREPPAPRPAAAPLPSVPPPVERTVSAAKVEVAGEAEHARYTAGWLVCLEGAAKGESFVVRVGRNTLGRDRKCDVYINDEQASGHHADLVYRPEEGRYILMDHNSTNGTYVNEVELEPRRDLVDRDVVTVGRHKFLFVSLLDDRFRWDDGVQDR
ncbi:MAG: FHA domain-containing protein [Acidobacteria bacterium]|nr:FHA domain-containing protein [Acidobacteriota bacterium]